MDPHHHRALDRGPEEAQFAVKAAGFILCLLLAAPAVAQPAKPDAITPDGARYYGQLRNGLLHGQGRLERPGGAVYQGGFADGLMSGQGRHETPDGEVHEGEFRSGEFTGRGTYRRRDGTRYEGEFLNWRLHGRGRFTDPGGNVYDGSFVNGDFEGKGTLSGPQGNRYSGEFKQWRFQGQGELRLANGDVYRGGFANGNYDGQGTLIFGKPRPDGTTQQSGIWRHGMLESEQREQRRLASANVEAALYNQRALLAQSIGALAPREPGRINLFVLAVGGDGSQEVFRREVEFVRRQFAERFGTGKRTIALVNSRTTVGSAPMATATSIREALAAISARMDRSQDILFMFLTSHGSREHELALNQNGMDLPDLSAAELARLLRESAIRWKVVVISACYSGGFLPPLKDDGTLVITAARHDRQSFGCADENDFTYFGRAYFEKALPQASSFQDAFRKAEVLVQEMEARELKAPAGTPSDERHSLPQMWSAPPIEQQLRRWWAQRK